MHQIEHASTRSTPGDMTSLGRFIAQPQNRLGHTFSKVLRVAEGALHAAGSVAGVDGAYADILQQQIEMQRQMMTVSMISNVERTRHETNMAGVRNMRVA